MRGRGGTIGAVIAALFVVGVARAAGADGAYSLSGQTTVHAEATLANYDRTFHPTLQVTLRGAAGPDVTMEVRRDGYTCALHGSRAGDTVSVPAGQKCPQSIKGDGFSAELDGTLVSGDATIFHETLALRTTWNVAGTVRVAGILSMPVTGTVVTDAHGPKE